MPKDTIQGAALATVMAEDGCTNAAILNDKEVYGAGLAENIEASAKEQGVDVATNEGIDPKAPNFRSQASSLKSKNVDCFVFAGVTPNGAVQLFKDVSAAVPDAKLYGPDGVSNPEFFVTGEGGIPADVADKVKVTVATLSPDQYPPDGQRFFDEYKQKYDVSSVDPYAIYGYEAMTLVLDTCQRLGPDCSDRQAMIDALFETKGRESVLGTYDIDENGDTTITDYGVYRVEDGEPGLRPDRQGGPVGGRPLRRRARRRPRSGARRCRACSFRAWPASPAPPASGRDRRTAPPCRSARPARTGRSGP